MITGELKNKIDKIWEIFWTGGITNPLDVIEQFTYLLFIKQLERQLRKMRQIFWDLNMSPCFRGIARNIGGASLKI